MGTYLSAAHNNLNIKNLLKQGWLILRHPDIYKVMITTKLNTAQLLAFILMAILAATACRRPSDGFSEKELALIEETDSIMRVLTVEDSLDNAVLRASSRDFSIEALKSETFAELARLMVATVTHPSQDGVGIAGPQVGLNRRVVAVQRFDKGTDGADG